MTDDNPTAVYEAWFDLAVRRTVASIAKREGAEALEHDVARLSEEQAKAVLMANCRASETGRSRAPRSLNLLFADLVAVHHPVVAALLALVLAIVVLVSLLRPLGLTLAR